MLHLGIDLHQAQMTIRLLDDGGNTLRQAKVSTRMEDADEFLESVKAEAEAQGGYRAIVEECGFTHWLVQRLEMHGCDVIVVVQPLKRARQKTDKRDAAKLAELLWLNRDRVGAGQRVHGIRQIMVPTEEDRQNRQLTSARIRLVRERTRVLNLIMAVVRQFNLIHDCPSKSITTKRARHWLRELELPESDRIMVDLAMARWDLLDEQVKRLDTEIDQRVNRSAAAQLVMTIPGAGNLTALAVASRIGSIDRFPRPASLANMIGVTPTINDSGESTGRMGGITKHGHPHMRFLLGQMVSHLTRADPAVRAIYKKIRKRRGAKIAMVAIMRRIACCLWHMFQTGEAYRSGSAPAATPPSDHRPLRGHPEPAVR